MTLLCTFRVGDLLLGLRAEEVREVIRHAAPTPVPLSPPDIVGLIHLRGEIHTVVDLSRRLGRPPPPPEGGLGLVLGGGRGTTTLRVDRAGDVVEVPESSFEPPPETLRGPARELVAGTCRVGDELVLLLDASRAVPAAG